MSRNTHRWLGIEVRHLAALQAVAETGSFARAARLLGYTQSAVSLQVAAVERAAGMRLLERRPGGRGPVVPTEAGERILRHAARITAQLQAAAADLTALADGHAGALRVGTFQSVSILLLPGTVRRFMDLRPRVEVRLHEASNEGELHDRLERGELDLSFTAVPPAGPFEHVELLSDPYVFLTQPSSALARRQSAPTLAEIGRLPLVAYRRTTDGVEALLNARGIQPDIVFRTDDSGVLQRVVAAGIGSALVSQLSVDPAVPDIARLAVSGEVPPRRLGMIWHRDRTLPDAARAFVEVVRAHCDELKTQPPAAGNRQERQPKRSL